MTMRYVAVTQQDINSAFHQASRRARECDPDMETLSASPALLLSKDSPAAVAEHLSELIMRLNGLRLNERCPQRGKRLQRFVDGIRRACRDFESLAP